MYIPPGTYRITKMLELTQSNVVVRGAGVSGPRRLHCLPVYVPALQHPAAWALRATGEPRVIW